MRRWELGLSMLILTAAGGCAVGGAVGYGGEADYSAGFYEPYGYDYGGWGEGYWVGPRWGWHGRPDAGRPDVGRPDAGRPDAGRPQGADDRHGPGGRGPVMHPAPGPMPSIPSRPRGH